MTFASLVYAFSGGSSVAIIALAGKAIRNWLRDGYVPPVASCRPQGVPYQAPEAPKEPSEVTSLHVIQRPASKNNYTSLSAPRTIDRIVIHTTEGSWDGACSWFAHPSSGVSAHFVVRASDGLVAQCVRVGDIAWHAGNGDYNRRSIGIEHEGYVAKPSWYTNASLGASAELVAKLCAENEIPIDREHIIGHDEVPDPKHPGQFGGSGHHDDPGPGFPWVGYMDLVEKAAKDYTPPRPEKMDVLFPKVNQRGPA